MTIRLFGTILTLALVAALLVLLWQGPPPDQQRPPQLHLAVMESFGADAGAGNVVGIEPYMEPLDYVSAESFKAKLDGYLSAAEEKGWIGDHTIVLLPEHIGTWLVATGQGTRVYEARDASAAMAPIAAGNLFSFLANFLSSDEPDRASAALIRMRSKASGRAQYAVYSNLARKYGVTLVAGSAALAGPEIADRNLSRGDGPIYNTSFVFGPDGQPQQGAILKAHPIPSETGFIKGADPRSLPLFESAKEKFGVLICADSWFDDGARPLAEKGARLLLVPSFLTDTSWDAPWGGYVNDVPDNNDWRADVGRISEGDAWIKYALPARLRNNNIRWGMNVFLKGELWGVKGSGRALIIEDGRLLLGRGGDDGAAIYNLWLGADTP